MNKKTILKHYIKELSECPSDSDLANDLAKAYQDNYTDHTDLYEYLVENQYFYPLEPKKESNK